MTPVPIAAANDVELCYDTLGDPDGVPVLLIAGLGVQLIDWGDHLLAPLVDAGLHLILFDNRDAGLSSRFHGAPDDPAALIRTGKSPRMNCDMSKSWIIMSRNSPPETFT